MPDLQPILDSYNAITGDRQSFIAWEFKLHQFVQAGYSANDLVGVLKYILDENKNNPFNKTRPYSLALGPLLDLQRFSDLRSRAMQKYGRGPKPSTCDAVLKSWRGFDQTENGQSRTIGGVLKGMNEALRRATETTQQPKP